MRKLVQTDSQKILSNNKEKAKGYLCYDTFSWKTKRSIKNICISAHSGKKMRKQKLIINQVAYLQGKMGKDGKEEGRGMDRSHDEGVLSL